MLYPYHLLIAEPAGGARILALRQRAWRPVLLVPRQLCLFEAVPCAEVRWFEMANFARLQLLRLSPFARTGASAVRRGGYLLLWLWDADEVDRLLLSAGAEAGGRAVAAESMYLAVPPEGQSVRACTQVAEQVTVQSGVLLLSRLMDPHDLAVDGLSLRSLGHDWLRGGVDARKGRLGGGVGLFNRTAWVLSFAMVGWAVIQGAALFSAGRKAEALEAEVALRTAAQGIEVDAQRRVEADQRWLQGYAEAMAELDMPALLEALRPVLERHGVVIREWDSATDSVKVMLVTAGGDIRLPQLTEDLAAVEGVSQLQLLRHDELVAATFVFRPIGWVRGGARHLDARGPSGV
jgi:hypothetical protein